MIWNVPSDYDNVTFSVSKEEKVVNIEGPSGVNSSDSVPILSLFDHDFKLSMRKENGPDVIYDLGTEELLFGANYQFVYIAHPGNDVAKLVMTCTSSLHSFIH